jgi:hypothetical protein
MERERDRHATRPRSQTALVIEADLLDLKKAASSGSSGLHLPDEGPRFLAGAAL